jgi:ABC-2 type transport system permease protein
VLASAGEFQHRTVVTTLLAMPNRVGVLARKAVAATAFGVLLTTTAIASSILSGFVTATMDGASVRGGGIDEWLAVAGAVVVGGLWAVMASALGLLTRSTAVSLTAVLLWKFVIEGIIPIVLRHPGFGAWMPSGAAAAVVDAPGGSLSAPLAALVLAGYGLALCLAAAFSFLTKDPL